MSIFDTLEKNWKGNVAKDVNDKMVKETRIETETSFGGRTKLIMPLSVNGKAVGFDFRTPPDALLACYICINYN